MSLRPLSDIPEIPLTADGDAYAILKGYREQAPLARAPMGVVFALHHRHIELVMSDATRQLETEMKIMQGIASGPIYDLTADAMLFANGDAHRRRRAPVSRTFAFKLMDAMRPRVIALATELVEERLDKGPIDFVNEIAAQIPARIIAEILGIPRSDLPVFMQWIADTAAALGFVDLEKREQIENSLAEFNAYVDGLLNDRRTMATGDFISNYVAETAQDMDLSDAEIRTQVLGLILAGSDTTRGSLCMTLATLLSHREQWAAFCADPDALKKGVVNEGLRFEPIISGVPRVALQELDIDGYRIPAGTLVSVSLLSALRDPEVYAEPDAFNIRRSDHPRWHPIFGGGAHRCVGEALAKAELEETLAVIARLAPNTTLVGDVPKLEPGAIRQVGAMRAAFAR